MLAVGGRTVGRRTFDEEWQAAMVALNEQLHIENPELGLPEGHPGVPVSDPMRLVLVCETDARWARRRVPNRP
jgi:hypothetical protein